MRIAATLTPPKWRSSFITAGAFHLVVIIAMLLGPSLGLFPKRQEQPEITLVRLKGGGQNRPGWVKPTPAQPDFAPVSDGKPAQREVEEQPPALEKTQPPATKPETTPVQSQNIEVSEQVKPDEPTATEEMVETPEPVVEETPPPVEQTPETPAEEPPAIEESEQVADEPVAEQVAPEETGEGVGAKPGPEGPGVGARSDGDFPGADAFLSRVESEVQRRFNFHGRGSGARAEYHFFIDRGGKIRDLVLMESSGISSLDQAARSSLMRAKFPPLPPGFQHDRLGVTYYFYDAN